MHKLHINNNYNKRYIKYDIFLYPLRKTIKSVVFDEQNKMRMNTKQPRILPSEHVILYAWEL